MMHLRVILRKSPYAILMADLSYSVFAKVGCVLTHYIPAHDPHWRWGSGECGRSYTRDRVDRKWRRRSRRLKVIAKGRFYDDLHPIDKPGNYKGIPTSCAITNSKNGYEVRYKARKKPALRGKALAIRRQGLPGRQAGG